jgi:integrase/recombinase XerC/integrase/recombinase XerD
MSLTPLMTIFALFLKEMDEIEHASSHTLRAYRKDLEQAFNDYLNLSLPCEEDLLRRVKIAQMKWSELRPSSRQRKASTLKSFMKWLYKKKYISVPLNEKIEAPKVPVRIPHFLSIDEVLLLFSYVRRLKNTESLSQFYLALLYLLYGGGMRVSEACQVRWSNLRSNMSEVCVFGKGAKERWVVLPEKAAAALREMPRAGDYIWGHDPLKERVAYDWVRKLGKLVGLKMPLHPHALRHSYATHLVSAGINLRTLQELMGHSSLVSTEKYLHLSMDQLARTMETRHPLGENRAKEINSVKNKRVL